MQLEAKENTFPVSVGSPLFISLRTTVQLTYSHLVQVCASGLYN